MSGRDVSAAAMAGRMLTGSESHSRRLFDRQVVLGAIEAAADDGRGFLRVPGVAGVDLANTKACRKLLFVLAELGYRTSWEVVAARGGEDFRARASDLVIEWSPVVSTLMPESAD
jgi:hypothetical protein